MNRKTLVLPAVVGLLAPVLAGCGGTDSQRRTVPHRRRHHGPFDATKEAPAPLDPAYAYDIGTWNILRTDRPDPDGCRAATATRCPRPPSTAASRQQQREYRCTLRDG